MTVRLFLEDSYRRDFETRVVASADGWSALAATAFHPGGGGQPCDRGRLSGEGGAFEVSEVREDEAGAIWHRVGRELPPGAAVHGALDWPFRYALMRHHGLMHVVNAVAFRELGGVITGVQIGPDRSRIDFRLSGFSRERIPDLEKRVNDVIARGLAVSSSVIAEDEYRRRPELVRTLNVLPPVVDGNVRIVEIAGFDVQACGGTHVHSTGEIGPARVVKFDNKGKDNKRFYWELGPAGA
jgi:misacylated tRNA(Ala) deacylase